MKLPDASLAELQRRLTPVKRAPATRRLSGFGVIFSGRFHPLPDEPQIFYVMTVVSLAYFPVFPLTIYLCRRNAGRATLLGKISWRVFNSTYGPTRLAIFLASAFIFTLLAIGAFAVALAFTNTPKRIH